MRKTIYSFILFLILFFVFSGSVKAAGNKTFSVPMDVEQTSCRDMLESVNSFRTGSEAWYFDTDNTTKVYVNGAQKLTWDYNLEQVAIQRAYEVAVSFSHTRPNGTSCFTLSYNGTTSCGENIAAGYTSAERAFVGWREDDQPYSGQGHRRNMLSKSYTAVGIAHVRYQGVDFWVQEFGWSNSGAAATEAINETDKMVNVELNMDSATFCIIPEKQFISDSYGTTGTLPSVTGYYETSETWGTSGIPVTDADLSGIVWTSGNSSVVTVSGGNFELVGIGSAQIIGTAMYEGVSYSCTISVNAISRSISDSDVAVSFASPLYYLPEGAVPEITVTYKGRELTEGSDYTVSNLTNNKYVTSNAYVKITGTGNFSGYRYDDFTISARDIGEITFDPIPDQEYTGSYIQLDAVTGTILGQAVSSKQYNYTIKSYTNNINTGEATVTVSGYEPYGFTGEKTLSFKIVPKDISSVTVNAIEDQPYTGEAVTPNPPIYNGNRKLALGTDYTLSYSSNINFGKATVTITGMGNYKGSTQTTFNIIKVPVSLLSKSGLSTSYTYTSEAITPDFKLYYKSVELTRDVDYTLLYYDNVEVGTATIQVTGKGIYEGERQFTFKIAARSMVSFVTMSSPETTYYTGEQIKPKVTLTDTLGGKTVTLVEGRDYQMTYGDNVDAGYNGYLEAEGIGNYYGSKGLYFRIYQRSITETTVSSISAQEYTGLAVTPEASVTYGNKTLTKDTDYSLTYYSNLNAGQAKCRITGKGNYSGYTDVAFTISPKSVSSLSFSAIDAQYYTGSAITPEVVIQNDSVTLVKNTDYTLSYASNTSVGKATVTVTGKGNYKGTQSLTFSILQRNIADVSVSSIADRIYTGSEQKPALTLQYQKKTLTKGTDYDVTYSQNVNVGEATVILIGKGNYTGSRVVHFNITEKPLAGLTFSSVSAKTYTGQPITPTVTVRDGSVILKEGTDYTVSFTKNTNVGTAYIYFSGKGIYSGEQTVTFTISPKNVADLSIVEIADQTYTGNAIIPALSINFGSITLKNGTDYDVVCTENVKVGTATVTVTGKGNYTGTKKTQFTIKAKSFDSLTFTKLSNQTYTGKALTPVTTVKDGSKTLTKGTDYKVVYSNNINAGKATATLTGLGNYAGTKTLNFTIFARNIGDVTADSINSVVYTGKAFTPEVTLHYGTVKLKKDTDYTVSYSNNVKVGTATILVSGKGNYSGTKTVTFEILDEPPKNGFCKYLGGLFLFSNNVIVKSANGLVQDADNPSDWYYCSNGQVQNVSQLVMYDNAWFYVVNGKLDTTYSGYVSYDGGLFFVGQGRIMREVNGLAKDPNGPDWYFLANGQAQIQYTGLAQYDNAWFYIINGKLAEDYTGTVTYDGSQFNVVNGMLR